MQEGLFSHEDFSDNNKHASSYQVLARKYRPAKLHDMIGQDVLVKILSNAIKGDKVHHAILLTGIRGTGKTTTARIIALSLNCIGEDGNGSATIDPCGKCYNCIAILESRHQDVIEIDAASNTSVNDMRVIIDNSVYRPVLGRYKIYIIDEVHMLSNSAFNALLKTLEEPPQHLQFIFATTEIRKIPVTILSRCQRFDLKRIPMAQLSAHYSNVVLSEGGQIEQEAADIIARAADGSVRDGLSILDQALSLNQGKITKEAISAMLGLSDKEKVINIFDFLVHGNVKDALHVAQQVYRDGSDPLLILQDILYIIHTITKIKLCSDAESAFEISADQVAKFTELSIPFLSRSWQIIMKGIEELKNSDQQFLCLEMVLVRLGYYSASITPEEIIRKLESEQSVKTEKKHVKAMPSLSSAQQLLELLFNANELDLYQFLHNEVAIIAFNNNHIKINSLNAAPSKLRVLQQKLSELTGQSWIIERSDENGPSLAALDTAQLKEKYAEAEGHEISREILRTFVGSKIVDIKTN